MNATIEAVCTSCAKCIRANRRRKKLNLDFNPESQKELLLPRQRYGIDFYAVHNGEIIFSRGVPDELRSDNAPELMQGIVRQICAYLDIAQIVTGGHNPRSAKESTKHWGQ
jgi:hypothetical protein